jgi:hypothetical protein
MAFSVRLILEGIPCFDCFLQVSYEKTPHEAGGAGSETMASMVIS